MRRRAWRGLGLTWAPAPLCGTQRHVWFVPARVPRCCLSVSQRACAAPCLRVRPSVCVHTCTGSTLEVGVDVCLRDGAVARKCSVWRSREPGPRTVTWWVSGGRELAPVLPPGCALWCNPGSRTAVLPAARTLGHSCFLRTSRLCPRASELSCVPVPVHTDACAGPKDPAVEAATSRLGLVQWNL